MPNFESINPDNAIELKHYGRTVECEDQHEIDVAEECYAKLLLHGLTSRRNGIYTFAGPGSAAIAFDTIAARL